MNNPQTGRPGTRWQYPAPLRFLAHFFSYLFHPLFISSYVMAFLIFIHPYAFAGFDPTVKLFRFLTILIYNTLFPIFAVFLLWRLQLTVHSMHLRTMKERIIPYLIAMIFYWWTWHVYANLPDIPPIAIHFLLGAFLAVCGAWMGNIYYKISMHAIAVGGLTMFFFLFSFQDTYASGLFPSLALLVTGIVCTSRLLCREHTPFEIWSGLFIGLLAQWIGWQF
jgi:hypothetical protein